MTKLLSATAAFLVLTATAGTAAQHAFPINEETPGAGAGGLSVDIDVDGNGTATAGNDIGGVTVTVSGGQPSLPPNAGKKD